MAVTAPPFPDRAYRVGLWIIILVAVAPFISVLLAGWIAESHGCILNEGTTQPCIVMGSDWGTLLYGMGIMGWLMLISIPFAVVAIVTWAIVRALHRRWWQAGHQG